ncbi:unnamed protein product, partial [Musa banksii]
MTTISEDQPFLHLGCSRQYVNGKPFSFRTRDNLVTGARKDRLKSTKSEEDFFCEIGAEDINDNKKKKKTLECNFNNQLQVFEFKQLDGTQYPIVKIYGPIFFTGLYDQIRTARHSIAI